MVEARERSLADVTVLSDAVNVGSNPVPPTTAEYMVPECCPINRRPESLTGTLTVLSGSFDLCKEITKHNFFVFTRWRPFRFPRPSQLDAACSCCTTSLLTLTLVQFQDVYMQMPPITRFYSSACFLTTLACQLEIVNPFQVVYFTIASRS